MTEKQYNVRAGYYHEYTGICRNKEDNLTTNEVCNKLNSLIDENEQLKKELNEFKQLDIPIDKIEDTVRDGRGRTVGVYYND